MSMRPRPSHAVPAMTAQVARAAFPKGCLAIRVRDALGELFDDEQFAGLFAVRGRPALSPGRLALVSVLQFCRGAVGPPGRHIGPRPTSQLAKECHP
jgi:hypothetical protein